MGFVSGGGQCMIAGHNTKVGDVTDHTMDSVHVDSGPEGASQEGWRDITLPEFMSRLVASRFSLGSRRGLLAYDPEK